MKRTHMGAETDSLGYEKMFFVLSSFSCCCGCQVSARGTGRLVRTLLRFVLFSSNFDRNRCLFPLLSSMMHVAVCSGRHTTDEMSKYLNVGCNIDNV